MSGATPPLPPPRPKFPWDGPPEPPPAANCVGCKKKDEEEEEKDEKNGKVDIVADKPMTPNEMQKLGMDKGEAMLRANPKMDYVDIKVTGVDHAGTQWTSTGGQSRVGMNAAGRSIAPGASSTAKQIAPLRSGGY